MQLIWYTQLDKALDIPFSVSAKLRKMKKNNDKFLTKRVFKDGSKPRIVEENLTEKQAQERVQADMKSNPNADYYMLVYTKMKSDHEQEI